MGSSDGLRRGLTVENTGAPSQYSVGTKTLGHTMNVLGDAWLMSVVKSVQKSTTQFTVKPATKNSLTRQLF